MSLPPESLALTPPEDPAGLQIGGPSHAAAGTTAVVSSFRHLLTRTGPLRAVQGMRGLNQKEGFDALF